MAKGIGIDATEVARFKFKQNSVFVQKVFSARERAYCFAYKDAAVHLAGTFAAKEAASKALGTHRYPVLKLEIRRNKNGAPEVWYKSKRAPVCVSITHTKALAIAIAAA